MKKVFMLLIAAGALAMASCGGNKKEDNKEGGKGLSACDCYEEYSKTMREALKGKNVIIDFKALEEECKDYKADDYRACGRTACDCAFEAKSIMKKYKNPSSEQYEELQKELDALKEDCKSHDASEIDDCYEEL